MGSFWQSIVDFLSTQGLNILLGIFVLVLGLVIIKLLRKLSLNLFKKKNIDGNQVSFIISILDFLLKIVVLVISLTIMNVETTSIIAVISTCSIAIGLALKDSLANLASGIIIVYNKPFKEGDYIDVNGNCGSIIGINLFTTILVTPDNKKIVIPNSTVLNSSLVNYDSRPTRRVDMTFSVAYGVNLQEVKDVIMKVIKKQKKILKSPEPSIRLQQQSASSLDFRVKVWTLSVNYWDVYYDLNEQVYDALNENNISIPFNQLDVHLKDVPEQINYSKVSLPKNDDEVKEENIETKSAEKDKKVKDEVKRAKEGE